MLIRGDGTFRHVVRQRFPRRTSSGFLVQIVDSISHGALQISLKCVVAPNLEGVDVRQRTDDGVLHQVAGIRHRAKRGWQSSAGVATQSWQITVEQPVERVSVADVGIQVDRKGKRLKYKHLGMSSV